MNWIFVTAGVGSVDFEHAADRLGEQVSAFNVFSKIQVFKTADVEKYCPELKNWYPNQNLNLLKGYGWYVWKSRFARIALEQNQDADGIFYLDAGCEALPNYFSKRKLTDLIAFATQNGACVFRIPTPEIHYTKKILLDRFNLTPPNLDGFQFQSGSWLFSKEVGNRFILEWDDIVWENKLFCDESESIGGEFPDFRVNRYDQSVFSPLVRKYGFSAYYQTPPGSIESMGSRVRFFFFPFAWARNRSGISRVSKIEKMLSRATLKLYELIYETR